MDFRWYAKPKIRGYQVARHCCSSKNSANPRSYLVYFTMFLRISEVKERANEVVFFVYSAQFVSKEIKQGFFVPSASYMVRNDPVFMA